MKRWKKGEWDITYSLRNWTFGFWWGRLNNHSRHTYLGFDLGPISFVKRKKGR